jgi:hypothetical protein
LLRNAFKYIRACLLETNARACPLLVANARARPGNPATRQPGNPATRQPGNPAPGCAFPFSILKCFQVWCFLSDSSLVKVMLKVGDGGVCAGCVPFFAF